MLLNFGLLFVLFLILLSEFVNGWTDSPNAIATVVSTRVLKPKWAVLLATVCNGLGAFYGKEVAKTIGTRIVQPEAISLITIGAAMVGIITWSTLAWYFGIPTSESHALISGLTGAALATAGSTVLLWDGRQKVLIGLVFSSVIGLIGGLVFAYTIQKTCSKIYRSKAKSFFGFLQIVSASAMAISHGSNDGRGY